MIVLHLRTLLLIAALVAVSSIALPALDAGSDADTAQEDHDDDGPVDLKRYSIPSNITERITVPSGYYVVLKGLYTFQEGTGIVFSEGSELRINIINTFTLRAVSGGYIVMEEGSAFNVGISLLDKWVPTEMDKRTEVRLDRDISYKATFRYNDESGLYAKATFAMSGDPSILSGEGGDSSGIMLKGSDVGASLLLDLSEATFSMDAKFKSVTVFGEGQTFTAKDVAASFSGEVDIDGTIALAENGMLPDELDGLLIDAFMSGSASEFILSGDSAMEAGKSEIEAELSSDEEGLSLTGIDAIEHLRYSGQDDGRLVRASIEDVSSSFSLEDEDSILVTIGCSADISASEGSSSTIGCKLDGMEAEFRVLIGEEDYSVEPVSVSGSMELNDNGIAIDFGPIAYDSASRCVLSEKATVSGNYLRPDSELMSVSGELRSVRVTMDDTGTPTPEFQAASLRFTNLDGAVMDCTASAGDGRISMDLDVKGEFAFRDAMDPVSIGAFLTSEAYSVVEVNAAGTGMLIDPDGTFIPGKTASAGGTYYVSESYSAEDLSLELDFHGTVLGIVPGGMTVAALNGFTLDPSSFSGFTLVDGAVVLDESILRAHGGVLRAESNGDPYTLTLDGKAHDAAYGDTVRLSVSSHAMAVFDADGRSYGSIEDGMWTYVYGHHGDLTLTSVDGKDVVPIADGVRTVGSDAIRFTAPSSFGYLGFELSSGVIAEFSSEDLGPGSKASFCAIPGGYEGYRSFSIYCNGPATVCFPVQSEGTALFHIVKGQSVSVPAVYEQRDGDLYLVAYLDSYSLYYLNEDYHPDEKEDGGFPTYLVLAGVAVAAVAIAAAVLVLRKRSSRGISDSNPVPRNRHS